MTSSLVVYKASAGSGKTFTLAVQYIKLLITNKPQEYQHTLAVTFTNKATAEMKERILEQLYGISLGLKDSEDYVEALERELKKSKITMSREEIRNQCRLALHEILHDYSRFRVETIDSFFQSVLRNLAHELGLSAKMQVDLNDKQVLSQAVDNMVDDLGRKDGDVLPWIDNYIKERLESGEQWDVRDDIKDFAQCIFSEDFMRRDEEMRQRLTSSEHLDAFRKDMYQLEKQVETLVQQGVETLRNQIAISGINVADDVNYGKQIESFINKVENFRETLSKSSNGDYFWGDALSKITTSPDAFIKKPKQKNPALMNAASALIPQILILRDLANEAMRKHFTIRLALKHLNPLRLLNHIDQEVTEVTNDSNRFILAKTPILLSRLIEGSDAPFVFERMGTLFHHVMIDEFQDTSRLQWQNFKVLMLENQSQGGSDLLVGDIKQSIYRWRNGDWHILANIKNEMASHNPEILDLATNFRSEQNIIDFNNKFFSVASKIIQKEISPINIYEDIYKDVKQLCNKKEIKGWVRTVVYEKDNKDWEEQMLDDLCEQVAMLHDKGVPYEEMCILQRDRGKVDRLIEHFKKVLPNVALVSDEAFKLESSRALNMLICALKVLHNGDGDPVSMHLLMRHYLTDIQGKNINTSDYTLEQPENVLPKETFLDRRDELKNYPLQELCEEIYRVLDINKIKGEDSYLLSFYDELAQYLQNAPGDIASFLDYWEDEMFKKAIPACKVNGISIITIHKSKGLQYHTVLMPYCDFSFEKFKANDLLWCEPQNQPFNGMEVLPIQPGNQMRNSLFHPEMDNEAIQKNIEELNALYVAFTRAEKNLLVWCNTEKSVSAGDTISRTLSGIMKGDMKKVDKDYQEVTPIIEEINEGASIYTEGSPVFEVKKKKDEHENRLSPAFENQTIEMCSYNRKHDFMQSTEGMLFIEELDEEVDNELLKTADGLTYAQQGSLLHEIFSKIEQAESLSNVIQEYVDNGVLANDKQVERITRLISRALHHRDAKHWFDGTYTIQNECEIAFYNPQKGKAEVLRPDRVMMNEEEIIVVDFKFGKPHPEEYHDQVQGYMNLLQQMYPGYKLSGFIWYVYRNQIVEV